MESQILPCDYFLKQRKNEMHSLFVLNNSDIDPCHLRLIFYNKHKIDTGTHPPLSLKVFKNHNNMDDCM